MIVKDLARAFKESFKNDNYEIYFSPGRVNLIGEHTDYNGGLVMPCAITLGTYMIVAPNNENILRFRSRNFTETADIVLESSYKKQSDRWYNYPLGVINMFLSNGVKLQGLDIMYEGNIPIGSGLSSSASIEMVTAFALKDLFNTNYTKLDLVKICKSVENNFIGVNSGVMDQYAVAFGEENKAMLLSCDLLTHESVSTNLGAYSLAIINTNKLRKLSESKYNERVAECQSGLKELSTSISATYLCDINIQEIEQYEYLLSSTLLKKRVRHVVEENHRVKLAGIALANNDIVEFGALMYESHDSLRINYEVSGKELDTIVEYCKSDPSVIGARMNGAGFGGCAIALVKSDQLPIFTYNISKYYNQKVGYEPTVYTTVIEEGVRKLSEDMDRSPASA